MRPASRTLAFTVLVGLCVMVAIGYTLRGFTQRTPTEAPSADAQAADAPADAEALTRVIGKPHLIFLHSPGGDSHRQVAVLPLDALDGPRYLTPLMCQRVYMSNSDGLCMGLGPRATSFNARFEETGTIATQPGVPTRARVSTAGDLGSMTWFVAGHSYADASFSTQTLLVDPRSGSTVADLEQFTILKDGAPSHAVDFNFWGVTFTQDASRFYATLATGGRTYLIEANVAERQARVLRENVECPSLSPDNTRIVFKKRVDPNSPREWRLAVLDLSTMEETAVPGETHSVDDQVEWLDNNHILYALQDEGPPSTLAQNIWEATLDGSEPPSILLKGAMSPAVVR